ncbi:hypothetical protein ACMAWI_06190 [Helicobacter pylori]
MKENHVHFTQEYPKKIPIALASANVLKAVGVFEKVKSIPHATHFDSLSQRFKME